MNINFIDASGSKPQQIKEKLAAYSLGEAFIIFNLSTKLFADTIKLIPDSLIHLSIDEHKNKIKPNQVYTILENQEYWFNGKDISLAEDYFHFSNLVSRSLNEIYIFSEKGFKFKFANEAALKNLQYNKEEIIQLSLFDIQSVFTQQEFIELTKPLIKEEKEIIEVEAEHVRKDGTTYTVEVHLSIISEGEEVFFTALVIDITEKKVSQKAFYKAKEQLELLANNFPNGSISLIDKDLNILFTGGQDYQEHGIDASLLIGKRAKDVLINELYLELEKNTRQIKNGQTMHYNVQFEERIYKNSLNAIKDQEGNFSYYVLRTIDNTDLIKKQNELEVEKNKYHSITKALDASALVSITDIRGIIIHANKAFCMISGFSETELIGNTHSLINSAYHPKEFWTEMWDTVIQGKTWRSNVRNKAKNGHYYWVDTVINPILNVNGKIEKFLAIRHLITHRKELEENREALINRLALATKAAQMGIWTYEVETRAIFWDEKMLELYRIETFDSQFETFTNLIHENDRAQELEAVSGYIEDETIFEYDLQYRINTRDDEEVYVKGKAIIERENGIAKKITGVVWDITEEKKKEVFLTQLTNKLQLATKAAEMGVWSWDFKSGEVIWDEAMKTLFGSKYFDGKIASIAKMIHPDDVDDVFKEIDRQLKTSKEANYSFRVVQPSGKIVYLKAKAAVEDIDGVELFVGVNWDITEEKDAERQIKEKNDELVKLEQFIDQSNDAIQVSDEAGRLVYINNTAATRLDIEKENVSDYHVWDFEPLFQIENAWGDHVSDLKTNGNLTLESTNINRKTKERFPVEVTVTYKNIQGQGYIIANSRDISDRKEAEKLLKESQEKYELALLGTNDGFFDRDLLNNTIFYSERWFEILGIEPNDEDKSQGYWHQFIHPEDKERVLKEISEAERGTVDAYEIESRRLHKDGHYVPILAKAHISRDATGKATRVTGVIMDLTKLKKAQEAILESEAKHRFLVESSQELICIHAPEGHYKFVSPSISKLTGYEPEELIGKDPYQFFHPDDITRISEEGHKPALAGESTPNIQYRFKKKDGTYLWFDTYTDLLKDENGKITSLLTGSRDITDQKESEMKLAESEEMLNNIADNIPGVIWRYKKHSDGTDEMDYVSKGAINLWGVSREDVLNDMSLLWEMIHPDDISQFSNSVNESGKNLTPWNYEYRIIMGDGQIKWLSAAGHPKALANGTIMWHSVALDVTDRRKAELALEKTLRQLNLGIETAEMGIWELDLKMDHLTWNDQMFNIFEVEKSDFKHKIDDFRHLIISDDLASADEEMSKIAEGKTVRDIRFRIKTKSGKTKHIYASGAPVLNDKGEVIKFMGINMDVSHVAEYQEQQERTLQQLNMAIETAKMGIWEWDMGTNELLWNDQALEIYDLTRDQFNNDMDQFWSMIEEEDRESLSLDTEKAMNGERVENHFKVKTKSGAIKHIHSTGSSILAPDGSIKKLFGVNLDITSTVEYQQKLEDALQQKDTLFKELHHRIKNNLQMVTSLLSIKQMSSKDKGLGRFIKETSTKIYSISAIHEQLLQMQGINKLDVKEYLERLIMNLVHTYSDDKTDYQLDLKIAHSLLDIDTVLNIGLIVNEVISNIIKYAYPEARGGKITVHLQKNKRDFNLLIADEGIGIGKEKLKTIQSSYGLQLITLFAKQINGELSIATDKGTGYTINFPTEAC